MKNFLLFAFIIQVFMISCKKEIEKTSLSTYTYVINQGIYSAEVNVEGHVFTTDLEYAWGFYYGTTANPQIYGISYYAGIFAESCNFSATLDNLLASTTYYVQPFCERDGHLYVSNEIISFQTEADPYPMGSVGPGGGIVFYSDGLGGGMEMTDLEASGNWGCLDYIYGTSEDRGTGAANTALILASCPSAISAPAVCSNLIEGGYDDWYLPSYDDLKLVYDNLVVNGYWTPTSDFYTSSSQCPYPNEDYYYCYNMVTNHTGLFYKSLHTEYFAVRSF
jgi:hypothetical protein